MPAAGSGPSGVGREVVEAVRVVRQFGRPLGDDREVAVPEPDELERLVGASVRARRLGAARLSATSVSRRRCSFVGRNWSSSASRASCAVRAAVPRSPARSSSGGHGRCARPRRGVGARAYASARARRAARRRARARARARRRRGSGARRRRPRARRRAGEALRQLAGDGGSKRTGWQREAIVGRTCVEAVGEQEQDDVVRRLLERLEQRVGGLVVHRLRALEHEDAPARPRTACARRRRRPARRRRGAASRARRSGDPGEVGVRPCAARRAASGSRLRGEQLGGERRGRRRACRSRPARGRGRRARAPSGGAAAEDGGGVRVRAPARRGHGAQW